MTRDEETSAMSSPLGTTGTGRGRIGRPAAIVLLAMTLAGCYTARETVDIVPNDYRQRHPIILQERSRTVEIFVGANRGGLTPAQRADVLAFPRGWGPRGPRRRRPRRADRYGERARRRRVVARDPVDPQRRRRAGRRHCG